jgi:hypothetical protein
MKQGNRHEGDPSIHSPSKISPSLQSDETTAKNRAIYPFSNIPQDVLAIGCFYLTLLLFWSQMVNLYTFVSYYIEYLLRALVLYFYFIFIFY